MANLISRMRILLLFIAPLVIALGLCACAKERPVEPVPTDLQRVRKTELAGEFLFLKSITRVESPSAGFRQLAPGLQMEASHIVQFVLRENQLEVYSSDPVFEPGKPVEKRRLLASFECRHVDVLPKRNSDGENTHLEEETQTRRSWSEREFVLVDWTRDLTESWPSELQRGAVLAAFGAGSTASKGWTVERTFVDGSTVEVRYQMLPRAPTEPVAPRPYPREHQLRYGFLKKTEFEKDGFGRFTHSGKKDFLIRWDTTKPIRFYVHKSFPEKWKPVLRYAVRRWQEALLDAVGDPLIELVWDDDSPPGDLSKNQIHFDKSAHDEHGLLGYAPVVWDPRSARIMKADIYLYGRVLQRALFFDELWRKGLKSPTTLPATPSSQEMPPDSHGDFGPSSSITAVASTIKSWRDPAGILQSTQRSMTVRADNCFVTLHDGWLFRDSHHTQSLADIETAVVGNLVFHEMGHTLGMRHNFMGSADTRHHATGSDSSTVMDYPLAPKPVTELGKYDKEALRFAYSPSTAARNDALSKNYYYCSDEDRLSSRLGLCQAYDQGSSLTEMIQHQRDRYFASNWVYHPRWDQVLFPKENAHYDQLLMALLLPIRNAHDNADAILRAAEGHDYEPLWNVAGQRIETDVPCDATHAVKDCYEIEIRPRQYEPAMGGWDGQDVRPFKRYLDENKIRAVVNDAAIAKEKAVEALRDILLFTDFPDHDVADPVDGSVVLRGVLRDKLAAVTLLGLPLPDPLNPQVIISPFSTRGRFPVAGVFASLLSNTLPVEGETEGSVTHEPTYFDMHLRRHALQLLVDQLIKPGHSAEARELLEVMTLPRSLPQMEKAPENPADLILTTWKEIEAIRAKVREAFFVRYSELALQERLGPGTRVTVEGTELQRLEVRRRHVESAFTPKNFTEAYLASANMRISGLPTATGLLIRDNINRAEDRMKAVELAIEKVQREIFLTGAPSLSALMASTQLNNRKRSLSEYIAQERLFLEQIYNSVNRP